VWGQGGLNKARRADERRGKSNPTDGPQKEKPDIGGKKRHINFPPWEREQWKTGGARFVSERSRRFKRRKKKKKGIALSQKKKDRDKMVNEKEPVKRDNKLKQRN